MSYKNKEWLIEQYWNQGKSTKDIGKICNCNHGNIIYFMQKFNIPRRSKSEGTKLNKRYYNKGEENVDWKGDNASYSAIHKWVNYHKIKSGVCSKCKSSERKTLWMNIDHKYNS